MKNIFKGIIALSLLLAGNPLLAQTELSHTLYINEVMQSTFGGDLDRLYEYPDSWVEIYNPGSSEVSLEGYRIGKKSFKKSFELPALKVPAHGHAVIFCDKEEQAVYSETKDWWGNVTGTKLEEVHTDFKLSTTKESSLYLYAPDKQMVDSVLIPVMPAVNVAYGRLADGSDSWGYELNVTKGAANSGGHAKGILPDPSFSPSSFIGSDDYTFMNVKARKLSKMKLLDGTPVPDDAVIRITRDGSEPNDTSEIFDIKNGIYVFENTVIRAAIFMEGYITPKPITCTYLFHNRKITLPTVSMVVDSLDLYDKEYGIFTRNLGANNPKYDWRRPATMAYFSSTGLNAAFVQPCEIRVGGAYSRSNKLKSIIVYADDRFKTDDWFEGSFWPTTTPSVKKAPSLALRSSGNDFGNSHMRDGIAQIVMGMYTDLDWQGFQPAIYYINGKYQGIINIRERANEDNVWSHYNQMTDITVIENRELKKGDWQLFQDFEDFYSTPGHTYAEYDSVMDLVEYTNHMIDNIFMDNTDFPGNNNVLWRPNEEGGRWRWILKDVDRAFGIWGYKPTEEYLKWCLNLPSNISGQSANGEKYTRLFRSLMEVPEYRDMFLDRFTVYMGDFLTPSNMSSWIDWGQSTMDAEYEYFSKAQGVSGKSSWMNTLNDMKKWAKERWEDMYWQLQDYYGLSGTVNVALNKGKSAARLENISINGVQLSSGKLDGKLYSNRDYTISGTCQDVTKEIIGWEVKVTDAKGAVKSETVMGSSFELNVAEGTKSVEISSITGVSGIMDTYDELNDIKSAVYFNAQGIASDTPYEGLNIIRYTLGDGRVVSVKKMMDGK